MTVTHFTAWLVNDSSALDQDCMDLSIIEDEAISYSQDEEGNETPVWASQGDQQFYAVTTIDARTGNIDDAKSEAEDLMAKAGWKTVGDWDTTDNAYVVTVERVTEDEEPTTYTAALATASDVVAGDFCDVSVVQNEVITYRQGSDGYDIPVYGMTATVAMEVVETTVRTDADNYGGAETEADEILAANGWTRVGDWEPADNAYYALVEKA